MVSKTKLVLFSGLFLGIASGCIKNNDSARVSGTEGAEFEGVATYFDSLGFPYGGCGVPENVLDTPYFVALNVQDTPGDYDTFLRRPITESKAVGAWDNGRNCGRWVRVTIGDFCKDAVNSGQKGAGLCKGGSWIKDEFNGATLDLVVTDSCQDDNVWCRDVRDHLDLSTASIEKFKPGLKNKWGNRKIAWHYIDAPSYQGDISIGFRKDAQPQWPAFIINHLQRGLHRVEQEVGGSFQALNVDGDMGQSFVLQSTPDNRYKIRLFDAYDQPMNGGRVYEFAYPASCNGKCSDPFVKVEFNNSGSFVEEKSVPTTEQGKDKLSQINTVPVVAEEKKTAEPAQTNGQVTAEIRIKSEWQGGYCADLFLHNASGQKVNSWSVVLRLNGSKINQQWNMKSTPVGDGVRLEPAASWNSVVESKGELGNQGFCAELTGGGQKASVDSVSFQ